MDSNNRIKSVIWYLINLKTESKSYLFVGDTKIGRHAQNIDIKLSDRFVSKLHCVINLTEGIVHITDMVSYIRSLKLHFLSTIMNNRVMRTCAKYSFSFIFHL